MRPHTIAAGLLLSLLATAPWQVGAQSSADSTRPFVPPATIQELEERITHLLDSTKTPGAGLAIVRNDSVILARGFGKARVSPERPATAATLFRIGSTSKAFVALAAMQLQREGKFSIQDPIRKYLPDLEFRNDWEATDPVRIVHLLEHTSGFDDNSLRTYANNDPTPVTLEEGLKLDPSNRVSRWRPGTRFSYCNTGPAVVALIIERIEGKPFEEVIQERFFTPLGMQTATYLFPDTTRVEASLQYRNDGVTPYPYWHVFIRPAGSINASANDMAQYVRFLLGRGTVDGKTLLTREDIERMEHAESWIGTRAGLEVNYGLHLYRTADSTGFIWTGHNGGLEGGLSDLSYIPDANVGYAFQINTGNGSVLMGIGRLVRGFLTLPLTRPSEPPVASVPDNIEAEFAGWYRPITPRQQKLDFLERIGGLQKVSFTNDTMRLRPLMGKPTLLVAVDSTRFRSPGASAATAAFIRDEANDRPHGLELDWTSMAQVSTPRALTEVGLSTAWLAATVLGLLAVVLVPLRWLVRKIKNRPLEPSVARPLWRTAMVASLLILVPILALVIDGGQIASLGNLTWISGTLYVAGLLFAAWAVFGLFLALFRRNATTGWGKLSLWTARGLLVLQFIAAVYFMYFGPVGWKTWG